MRGTSKGDRQRNAADPATASEIETEIERIGALGLGEARTLWRDTFRKDVPKALTRDLLVRTLCWHIQEQVYGGHRPAILKLLASYTKGSPGDGQRLRRLRPGTELVREYQGERHTVVVTKVGFLWQGESYLSLTAIARAITGTGWNGPRFFGLREGGGDPDASGENPTKTKTGKGPAHPKDGAYG